MQETYILSAELQRTQLLMSQLLPYISVLCVVAIAAPEEKESAPNALVTADTSANMSITQLTTRLSATCTIKIDTVERVSAAHSFVTAGM